MVIIIKVKKMILHNYDEYAEIKFGGEIIFA
jgi:hypothetical protein